jgi:hypothetical protein
MRIIKAAKLQSECRETCYNCKSILGVTTEDLNWEDMHWYFECPVCGKRNEYASSNKEDLFKWIMEDEEDAKVSGDNSVRLNTL